MDHSIADLDARRPPPPEYYPFHPRPYAHRRPVEPGPRMQVSRAARPATAALRHVQVARGLRRLRIEVARPRDPELLTAAQERVGERRPVARRGHADRPARAMVQGLVPFEVLAASE